MRRAWYLFVLIFALVLEPTDTPAFFSRVMREDGKTYILDATGERWDVTQAESIGFKPEGFQYGLGKNAFTPLDDSYLTDDTDRVSQRLRVLGVVENAEAQAYSIPRLRGHEIANSRIGSKAIAVGY
ncbi:MAG: DUF3179 domain-containing protein [Proteobacteria bacterium]|nr:DUF3179 domain-containing protein [Pseudomonadota bacterium]